MKSVFLFTALLTACGATPVASSGPPRVTIPVAPSASVADPGPPPSLPSKEALFPKVARRVLPNGLEVAVVEAHALPIVQVRLFVRAGMGYGGPALASLTAQLLKDGGTRSMKNTELVERIERLGATLSVQTGLDSTVLGLGITKEHLSEAIAVLAEMVRSPRFEETELDKLKARATDEAEDSARSDGSWTATRVLFHELYQASSPYAVYDASPADIRKVTGKTVRAFHRRFYVPKNTTLVVAGDTTLDAAADVAVHSFGTWAGGEAPVREAVPLVAAKGRRVVIAHRPQSAQSDVFAVGTVPARDTPDWPAIRVATQVLGGGPASRLFMDVREKRSLAYQTRASLIELAQGPQPVVAYAGTRTAKTAEALDG
ncbi:MAG: pitrilysin family protein, partial [Myxococcales bacterium]